MTDHGLTVIGSLLTGTALVGGVAVDARLAEVAATPNYTELAAGITVVGGALVGLGLIAYERFAKARVNAMRDMDEARKSTITGQYKTALATIAEQDQELARATAKIDTLEGRHAAEIKRLSDELVLLKDLLSKALDKLNGPSSPN